MDMEELLFSEQFDPKTGKMLDADPGGENPEGEALIKNIARSQRPWPTRMFFLFCRVLFLVMDGQPSAATQLRVSAFFWIVRGFFWPRLIGYILLAPFFFIFGNLVLLGFLGLSKKYWLATSPAWHHGLKAHWQQIKAECNGSSNEL